MGPCAGDWDRVGVKGGREAEVDEGRGGRGESVRHPCKGRRRQWRWQCRMTSKAALPSLTSCRIGGRRERGT